MPRCAPASAGPLPPKLLRGRISEFAEGNPAARRHSNDVGMLLPANSAYAAASYQLTPPTGIAAVPSGEVPNCQEAGPGLRVASRNSSIACCQESGFPSLTKGCFQYSGFWYPPPSTNLLNSRLVTS